MEKIIIQIDSNCGECDCELPRGSHCFTDGYDDLRCDDCYEKDMIGETYG